MKRSVLSLLSVPCVAALGLAAGGKASAQDTRRATTPSGLEEVVVTATRRSLDLQEVPMSIMALTTGDLEMQGIGTVEGLQGAIPNLNIIGGTNGGISEVGFTLRGIPRVSFYIDGIWQPYSSGKMDISLEDVERVEVLRGPQGTLYGRDSTGGAIRIVTSRPASEFQTRASVTMGSYDRQDVLLGVDIPLTENVRTRFNASQLNRDGYVHSTTLNEDLGQIDMTNVSADLVWTPTDRFSMRTKYSDMESHPTDGRINTFLIPFGARQAGLTVGIAELYTLGGLPYDASAVVAGYPGGNLGEWETALGDSRPADIETEQAVLDFRYDLTDNITLQALTGSINFSQEALIDWDGVPYKAISTYQYREDELLSQEIQLLGSMGRFDWVTGVYYWDQKSRTRQAFFGMNEFKNGTINQAALLTSPVCTAPTTLATCAASITNYINTSNIDSRAGHEEDGYSIFGEVTIGATEKLDVIVGARLHQQDMADYSLALIPGVTAAKPANVGPFPSGDPLAGVPTNPRYHEFDTTTTRLGLKYQFTDNMMGYLTYSEGFNAGGSAPVTTPSGPVLIAYKPETIKNYEVGYRSELADGRLRFNASLFQTHWEDIQLRSAYRNPGIGVFFAAITQNVAGAEAEGIEAELTWLATSSLKVNFNLGLLDTAYTDFALGVETPVNAGDDFAQAPEKSYSVGLQHTASFAGGSTFTSRLDYSYVGGFQRYADPNNHPDAIGLGDGFEAGDYGLVDARLVYTPSAGNWEVAFFGTNLTDKRVLNGGFYAPIWEVDWSTVGRPREGGVELKVFFE
jgi:iron complex outermembrane recepter protein